MIDRRVDVTERKDGLITVSLEFRCPKRGLFYVKSETCKTLKEARILISNFHQMISAFDEKDCPHESELQKALRERGFSV